MKEEEVSLLDVLKEVQESYKFTKEATVGGVKYVLRVLTVDQEKVVNTVVSDLPEEDIHHYIREMRKEILCRAIIEIKGEQISDVVETPEGPKDKSIFLKEFLSTLPDTILKNLFDAYVDLREESEENINKNMQYNWYKTPEQRDKEYEEESKKENSEKKDESSKNSEDSNEENEDSNEENVEDVKLRKVNEVNEPELPPNIPEK